MKNTNTKSAPRTYAYAVVAYYGGGGEAGLPVAYVFRSTYLAAAKRKAYRLGLGGRDVMTLRAAVRILDRV